MGVGNDDGDALAMIALEPVMHHMLQLGRQVAVARAGIPEQSALCAEDQIEKRHLRIRAAGLAQDEEVGIVLMHLPLGNFHALRSAGGPLCGKRAALQVAAVGIGKLAVCGRNNRRWNKNGDKQQEQRTLHAGLSFRRLVGSC
jgi:hypothetical protein